MFRLQGGQINGFGGEANNLPIIDNFNLGPTLVRGFAPGGIGPRDISDAANISTAALGGTTYFGGSAEVQFPLFGLPKELGLKGAVFVDAGTLYGYTGPTNFSGLLGYNYCPGAGTQNPITQPSCLIVDDETCDAHVGRREPDLEFADRAAALRPRLSRHQGQVRPDAVLQLHRRRDVLIVRRSARCEGAPALVREDPVLSARRRRRRSAANRELDGRAARRGRRSRRLVSCDVAPLDAAGPGDLTFLDNSKYLSQFAATRAAGGFRVAAVRGAGAEGLRDARSPRSPIARWRRR